MGRVRALLAGLLLTLVAAPAAHAQGLADPLGSPVDDLQAAADPAHVLIFTETTQFRHTEAIEQGTPKLVAALEAAGVTADVHDSEFTFSDASLAPYDAVVMFQASGDPWTAPGEKEALERYMESGKGIAAIHNATDMRGGFAWWDQLVGSLMPGHAATGSSPGQPGEIIVEDRAHPATRHLGGTRWARADEWYNFATNVRGTAHVLLSMDESTYDPGGNAMGYDHPIAWCKPYDGGRAFVTALGHFGAHYDEAPLLQHLVGGIQYAAGVEEGDCGGTVDANFEKVTLDDNTSAPFALDVAPDGRVFFTELVRGQIRVWDPQSQNVKTALTLDVYSGGEDGLLGITLDPGLRRQRLALRLLRARQAEQRRPVELLQPREPLHRRRELGDRPGVRAADHRGPRQPRAGRARPHRRSARLRPRRQPAARRRRRRQPALRALGRVRAAVRARRHLPRRPRHVGEHERPARQAAADHARRRRRLHDPGGQPVPGGDRADPAGDLRDGLPQPVPLLRRPGHRLDRPRRLRARLRHRAARRPRARPGSSSTT